MERYTYKATSNADADLIKAVQQVGNNWTAGLAQGDMQPIAHGLRERRQGLRTHGRSDRTPGRAIRGWRRGRACCIMACGMWPSKPMRLRRTAP